MANFLRSASISDGMLQVFYVLRIHHSVFIRLLAIVLEVILIGDHLSVEEV